MNAKETKSPCDALLEPDQVRRIADLFNEEFAEDPHYRVARKLRVAGFTADHVRRFCRTSVGRTAPDNETIGVENAMRNLEKGLSPRLPRREQE